MKLAEFKKVAGSATPVPGGSVEPSAGSAAPSPAEFTTSTTPSGVEILYQWAPRRLYRLNGVEVPSVTTVLGVLDRSGPLTWWGQKIGVQGMSQLQAAGELWLNGDTFMRKADEPLSAVCVDTDGIVAMLTEHRLSVNHVKDSAADRGVNVHGALEQWANTAQRPITEDWPEAERGYIEGLGAFIAAVEPETAETRIELMVGSLEHQYAGRFDLVLTLSKPVEVVTRHYPKKKDKVEEIPAGRWMIDLKTSKNCYPTHALQLAAYRQASIECGYGDVDGMAVVRVGNDGGYEFRPTTATFDQFLAVRAAYETMETGVWFAKSVDDLLPENEREVLAVLKDELGAKEVST